MSIDIALILVEIALIRVEIAAILVGIILISARIAPIPVSFGVRRAATGSGGMKKVVALSGF